MTPPLLVNHCTMSKHSLVIVIRTKQAMQPEACKLAHSVLETRANTGLRSAFLSPIATPARGRGSRGILWQLERDAAFAVQSQSEFAIDAIERHLLLFVLQGDVMQIGAIHRVRDGGTDHLIFEGDQIYGR